MPRHNAFSVEVVGVILVLMILSVIGFFAFNQYIYDQKQGAGNDYEPYRGTLTGDYVCVPHRVRTGMQTDECVYGIQTDAGEYYAVDTSLMSQTPPTLILGERFKATGVITPIERLSSDHWQKYDVEGIFSITDSLEKL